MKLKYHAKYNDAFRLCFSSTLLFFTRKTYREELKGTGEWWKERKDGEEEEELEEDAGEEEQGKTRRRRKKEEPEKEEVSAG